MIDYIFPTVGFNNAEITENEETMELFRLAIKSGKL